MPNRYIREAAITSKAVNALTWQGEVFWRRLLNKVDDFGRYTADPELLRSKIFPRQLEKVRVTDIPRLLTECQEAGGAQAGLLFVYEVDSKPYLVMNQWEKGRAKSSKYPEPPESICKRLQTFVYTPEQMLPSPTLTPTPALSPVSDSDANASKLKGLSSKPCVGGDPRGAAAKAGSGGLGLASGSPEAAPKTQDPRPKTATPSGWTPFRPATETELELISLCMEVLGADAATGGQWVQNSTFWGNKIMGSQQVKAEPDKVRRVMAEVQAAKKIPSGQPGAIRKTVGHYAYHIWETFE